MINPIKRLLFVPSFLSFHLAAMVSIALPPLFSKYEIGLVEDAYLCIHIF